MPDFSGLATVYDVLCHDGRVIKQGAFNHQDGETVPLVWRHQNGDITNVLGHGVLSVNQSPPGMRFDATFNKSKQGSQGKELVDTGTIAALSIYANEVIEHMNNGQLQLELGGVGYVSDDVKKFVEKGWIREVSLVLSGMNPGAKITDVVRHSDDPDELFEFDGIIVHSDYPLITIEEEIEEEEEIVEEEEEEVEEETIEHQETEEDLEVGQSVRTIVESLNEEQEQLFDIVLSAAAKGEKAPPTVSVNGDDINSPNMQEVFDTLTEEQTNVLYYMAGELSQEYISSQGDQEIMPQNIFETDTREDDTVIAHEQRNQVLNMAAKDRPTSLKALFAQKDVTIAHSITDIDNMFPDHKPVQGGGPQLYSRPMEWVERVLGETMTRPFSRIRSWYADITADEARAKGYVKTNQKVEEVIAVLKRTTDPQTIYKVQKLDRDDILDITDFDVVVWLKAEMRLMLREELARAILISDGRGGIGNDAILTDKVRPIYNDSAVYTINKTFNDIGNEKDFADFTDTELIDLIDYIAVSMEDYRGKGSPTFYCQPKVLSKMMVVRDADGRRLHPTEASLAAELGVGAILPIPPMADMEDTDVVDPTGLPAGTYDIATLGVIVNLSDYVIGMDRGGQTSFFDDFDIDYNQYKYLYETRLSGALVNPMSAIAVQLVTAKTA